MSWSSDGLTGIQEQPGPQAGSSRTRVVVASGLAIAFAATLAVVAVAIAVHAITDQGAIGAAARDARGGRTSPLAGLMMVVALLLAGAVWLTRSAMRALHRGTYLGVMVPFGILLAVGSVGEISDLVGSASGTSDLVGAAILLLAAAPVVLLWRPLRESTRRSALRDSGDTVEP